MTDRLRAWGPAAAWAAVLFFLSASPIRLDDGWQWLAIDDKIVHFCLYTVMGAALAYPRRQGVRAAHVVMIGLGALYGALDEWHQSFVPGRDPSLGDWAADVVGVLIGYWMALLAVGLLEGSKQRESEEPGT